LNNRPGSICVINRRAAEALGLTIPGSILADEVIE